MSVARGKATDFSCVTTKNMTMKGANFLEKLLDNQPVEWKKLGEVCDIKTGKGVTKKDAVEDGVYPIISGGKTPMDYIDKYNRDANTVTVSRVGANAGYVNYLGEKFYLNDKCFSVIPRIDYIHSKFLYYILKVREQQITAMQSLGGVPTINTSKVGSIEIPIPPLSVQSRIVEILDKFTSLEAELEAELDCRKRQYIYYRELLLDFSQHNNIQWKKLGEVCEVLRGRRLTKKQLSQDKEGFAVYHGGVVPIGYYPTANRKANSTMVINVGASAGTVGYSREEYWSSDGCYCFTENPVLIQRFLFYYLQSIEHKIKSKVRVAGIPTLDANILYNLEIPLPPLSEQERIVEILDKFDTLTNSISEGLPLEIQLRRQQYEYYREQLLAFPHP